MNKLKTIEFIIEKCKKEGISAYAISKGINMSAVGIQKILDGVTKNPNDRTLTDILLYLENSEVSKNQVQNNTQNTETEIRKEDNQNSTENDLRELIACKKKCEKLLIEVARLQSILRKNSIEFDDTFEL